MTTQWISLLTAALALTACTSTSTAKKGKGADEPVAARGTPAPVVVQQAGRTVPAYSVKDRRFYLDLRQAKGILPRIEGALATGEAQAAVDLARGYLAKNPGDPRALTALAAALSLTRQYELATYYATLAERAQPGNAAALNIKGVAVMLRPSARMADFREAGALFQQAMSADEQQVAPGLNLGNLLLETGNAKGAVEIFKQTEGRCGGCVAATMGLGVALSRSRDFDGAKAAFERVLAENPRHPGALYNLALVYKNGYNKPKEAEKHLFALLNDTKSVGAPRASRDIALRERAQTVLRVMRGEATVEERRLARDDEAPKGNAAPAAAPADQGDAELLMTTSEFNDE